MKGKTVLRRSGILFAFVGIVRMLSAQSLSTTAPTSTKASVVPPAYVAITLVPSVAGDYLRAFGKRIQQPGLERTTLTGTYSDASGGSGAARLVWEVPGRLRFDRADKPASVLIYDNVTGLANASSFSPAELNILESLLNDSAEWFFYGFIRGDAHRYYGGRFRTDNGKTPDYQGPYYDIHQVMTPVPVQPGSPSRSKLFYFDSVGKLLVKTQYTDSSGVSVATEASGWTSSAGQSFPGNIVRRESGMAVFTFTVSSAAAGPSVSDGTFPGH
jgi:hypothetical protein